MSADEAHWAAAVGQGHVGRSRRLLRDADARERRAEVLRIPASLTSLRACLDAADHLVRAAEGEAAAISADLDAGETEALQIALGAGGTGKGAAATARGTVGRHPRSREAAALAGHPHAARRAGSRARRPGRVLP